MRYFIFTAFLFLFIACSSDTNTSTNTNTDTTNEPSSETSNRTAPESLIDKAVGTYTGKMRFQSSSELEGAEASIKITKESDTTIKVTAISGGGSDFTLTLDEEKSNAYALSFRDSKGQKVGSLMNTTFSYNLPIADNDIENFNGNK